MPRAAPSALYADYTAFKGWTGEPSTDRPEDLQFLLERTGKAPPFSLLDIGFGAGGWLDHAKAQGVRTSGSEIIPELRARGKAAGHQVFGADLSKIRGAGFDVITAIDVLEHLTTPDLQAMLAQVARLLTPGGLFMARFPNGLSPFSGPFQNGDLTHLQRLTPNSVRQLAEPAGLRLTDSFNPRPFPPGAAGKARRWAVYALRDLVEVVVDYAYYGVRYPMDPNVVVILQRPAG